VVQLQAEPPFAELPGARPRVAERRALERRLAEELRVVERPAVERRPAEELRVVEQPAAERRLAVALRLALHVAELLFAGVRRRPRPTTQSRGQW
jgi:hypothetical protein